MGSHHYMCDSTRLWVIQASLQELNISHYYNLSELCQIDTFYWHSCPLFIHISTSQHTPTTMHLL